MTIRWRRAGALVALAAWAAVLLPAAAQAAVGSVAGTVTPLEWAQEVEVCLVEGRPSETCTVPKADGTYRLEVPLGEVEIEFVPSIRSRLLTQYYDHQASLAKATRIVLTPENPAATEIDADLTEGGAIEGTVTAFETASPLAEIEVCAVSTSASVRRCEETDADGGYELHSLPGGSYTVAFHGRGKSAEYESSYYDGKQTLAQATPVGVTAGAKTSGIDAALEKGAKIEGSVTEAGGGRLTGISVCLFEAAAAAARLCTYSDDSGTYSFEGLAGGTYQVGFSLEPGEIGGEGAIGENDDFESQYYKEASSRPEAATIPILAPAVVAGVDGVLSRPPEPAAAIPPPVVTNPIVAAPPVISEPTPGPRRCKKGFRKKKVKRTVRCVRVHKAAHRHHKRHHRTQRGGKQ